MVKFIWPEDEMPEIRGRDARPHYEKPDNFFLAIIEGSQEGVKVILGSITALRLAATPACSMTGSVAGFFQRRDAADSAVSYHNSNQKSSMKEKH